jgi:hypothetical protein
VCYDDSEDSSSSSSSSASEAPSASATSAFDGFFQLARATAGEPIIRLRFDVIEDSEDGSILIVAQRCDGDQASERIDGADPAEPYGLNRARRGRFFLGFDPLLFLVEGTEAIARVQPLVHDVEQVAVIGGNPGEFGAKLQRHPRSEARDREDLGDSIL